jgi:hypothetical protein
MTDDRLTLGAYLAQRMTEPGYLSIRYSADSGKPWPGPDDRRTRTEWEAWEREHAYAD